MRASGKRTRNFGNLQCNPGGNVGGKDAAKNHQLGIRGHICIYMFNGRTHLKQHETGYWVLKKQGYLHTGKHIVFM